MRRRASVFSPIRAIVSERGPTKINPALLDCTRERLALREETVSWVDGFGPGAPCGLEQAVDAQITRSRLGRPDRVGLVRLEYVGRPSVGLGVHGDGSHSQLAAGTDHPKGDLTPVGHQQGSEQA